MPNPKSGTVTFEVGAAVKQLKAGRIEFRVDKQGNVHATVGKLSFSAEQLADNIRTLMDQIVRMRPSSVKGHYVENTDFVDHGARHQAGQGRPRRIPSLSET